MMCSWKDRVYECMIYLSGQLLKFDLTVSKRFEYALGIDPVVGWNEDEFIVDSILSHDLSG